jgi:hypothetical protein
LNAIVDSGASDMSIPADNRRDNVAKRLTPTQINPAQEMARKCQAKNFKNCD